MKGIIPHLAAGFLAVVTAQAAGHWAPTAIPAPVTVGHMQLLTDGTVLCNSFGGSNWFRLKPGSTGGYTNGTWGNFVNGIWSTNANVAPMHDGRGLFGSAVLRDGRLIVAGGEYGSYQKIVTNYPNQRQTSEIFDPMANTWTKIPVPADIATALEFDVPTYAPQWGDNVYDGGFVEPSAMLLPNGDWLVAPAYVSQTLIYNVASNCWKIGPAHLGYKSSQNETDWVKLPDDSILTVDKQSFPNTAQRYIPSLNSWIQDSNPIVNITSGNEYGPSVLLPDGRALFMGANGINLFYQPSGSTNCGAWSMAAGTPWGLDENSLPVGLGANDAPAVSLINGNILAVVSPIDYTSNGSDKGRLMFFFEFNYLANEWIPVAPPSGANTSTNTDPTCMLAMPDGTALFSDAQTPYLYIYIPDGQPLPTGKPTILSMSPAADGSYHLTGKLLNGLNTGAVYGDEGQMDSNFPIIRLQNGNNVYYCRTINRSSTGVMTGNQILSADFKLPEQLPVANYTLTVVANGIASDPYAFRADTWVDFNYAGMEFGSYDLPWNTLAEGVASATVGGRVLFRSSGHRAETITITNALDLQALGGTVTIGK